MRCTFFLAGEDLEALSRIDPDRDWRELQTGERAWILQTWLRLRRAGHPVDLSGTAPEDGLVVFHAKQAKDLLRQRSRLRDAVLVGVRADNREPLIAQKFLPAVEKGDKRIILVDGEPAGAINRVPPEGETRSNLHIGGTAMKVELTVRDREICAAIGPLLREKGQIFVGIDVIGDWLTEINVTSPTGLQELERFDGINATAKIWEAIERRRS